MSQDATAQTCAAADSALGALPLGQGKVLYDRITDSLQFEAPSAKRGAVEVRVLGLGEGRTVSAAVLWIRYIRLRLSKLDADQPRGRPGMELPVLVDGERRLRLTDAQWRDQVPDPLASALGSNSAIEWAAWPLTREQLVELAKAARVETKYDDVQVALGKKQLEGARAIAAAWLCQTPLR